MPPPPFAEPRAVLAERVEVLTVTVPKLAMPPPLEALLPKPGAPPRVELLTVSVPVLAMPPPLLEALLREGEEDPVPGTGVGDRLAQRAGTAVLGIGHRQGAGEGGGGGQHSQRQHQEEAGKQTAPSPPVRFPWRSRGERGRRSGGPRVFH